MKRVEDAWRRTVYGDRLCNSQCFMAGIDCNFNDSMIVVQVLWQTNSSIEAKRTKLNCTKERPFFQHTSSWL